MFNYLVNIFKFYMVHIYFVGKRARTLKIIKTKLWIRFMMFFMIIIILSLYLCIFYLLFRVKRQLVLVFVIRTVPLS